MFNVQFWLKQTSGQTLEATANHTDTGQLLLLASELWLQFIIASLLVPLSPTLSPPALCRSLNKLIRLRIGRLRKIEKC